MKKMFRLVTFVLLVGGWTLAAASVQAVRVPSRQLPALVPKGRLTFAQTYVDTRTWTVADDRNNAELVRHLVAIGRADLLAHTVVAPQGDVPAQLLAATAFASDASTSQQPTLVDRATSTVQTAAHDIRAKIN